MADKKRKIRFLPLIGFLSLAAALFIALTAPPLSTIRIGSYEMEYRPLPEFSLPLMESPQTMITNMDIKGEPAVINFFSSWCAPCRMEHPLLLSLSQKGYPIYGILWKDKTENITELLQEEGNPYSKIAIDSSGSTAIAFGINGVPESFVINREGIIVHRHIGPLSKHDIDKAFIPLLKRLRDEP